VEKLEKREEKKETRQEREDTLFVKGEKSLVLFPPL
jgi:hypothetical protein|tara:strand:- start:344 stop:451 length:108 start_codon:yes stop_codon:yes gene_type:complete